MSHNLYIVRLEVEELMSFFKAIDRVVLSLKHQMYLDLGETRKSRDKENQDLWLQDI